MNPYNITQMQNVTSLAQLFQYANDSTGGILIGMGLFAFFIITLFALKRYPFAHALLASSWVFFLISLVGSYLGLVPLMVVLAFLIIGAFTALYLFTVGRQE